MSTSVGARFAVITINGVTFDWVKATLKSSGNNVDTTSSSDQGFQDVASYVRKLDGEIEFNHKLSVSQFEALSTIFTDAVVTLALKPTVDATTTLTGSAKINECSLDFSIKEHVKGKFSWESKGVWNLPTPA